MVVVVVVLLLLLLWMEEVSITKRSVPRSLPLRRMVVRMGRRVWVGGGVDGQGWGAGGGAGAEAGAGAGAIVAAGQSWSAGGGAEGVVVSCGGWEGGLWLRRAGLGLGPGWLVTGWVDTVWRGGKSEGSRADSVSGSRRAKEDSLVGVWR